MTNNVAVPCWGFLFFNYTNEEDKQENAKLSSPYGVFAKSIIFEKPVDKDKPIIFSSPCGVFLFY